MSFRPRRRVLKNAALEADQFRRRAFVAFAGVLLALGGLALWYFRLQVWQHSEYATRSEENRIKLRPVVPARGLIYDRKGRILADNVPAYRLDVTPSEAGDSKRWLPELQKIVALSPEDIASYEANRFVARGFKPVTLKLRLTEEEAARFAVDRWRFPGVELQSYLNRRYLYGELLSHVIGYVGRVDANDLKTMSESDAALSHVGKTGLERFYEQDLRGKVGYEKIVTNVDGRPMYSAGRVPAQPGADLRLSIDLDLQQAMVTAFGDMDGSAVAIDPRTGEILAMVSLPAYDTNLFVNGIQHDHYRALMDNPSRPLFNRNVLGGGPPGSTVKPLIALAGLDSGMRTPEDKVFSTGTFYIPGQRRGWRDAHGGAGWTDLRKSISQSVNYYYYKLAYEMGIARFDQYMYKYGFGGKTGIDLAGENSGVVPSPEWKAKRFKEQWYPGETVNAGIGQGYWIATVLQLVRGIGAIANGGDLHRLHLVDDRRDGYDRPWTPLPQPVAPRITDNAGHLRAVQEGMIATIHGGGTGAAMARGAPYMMAGKTGTAQKISRKGNVSFDPHSLPYNLRHQALFVGYAPAENPTIAIAVSVEHGGFGGTAAAPIARKVFDAWLLGKMPEPVEGVTRSPQGGVLMAGREPPPAVQPMVPAGATPGVPVAPNPGAANAGNPPPAPAAVPARSAAVPAQTRAPAQPTPTPPAPSPSPEPTR
ncbi:penicillin-binding protein 2 [Lysobacter solisilvae (ex Woo and Kim 2020)]|uniref:Peptidoglycan D,D-transpeptidase MrdA n=1 Tax=Agrilutibacter terrestris TaxID=2865112 RepID=A0A7H0FUH5_9GAMM|nr:penicillin-binding protein 2 [Lysobacter terrestris]QNP39691.1 penicillin-binding protein 2 [Lysobacter terrestris]